MKMKSLVLFVVFTVVISIGAQAQINDYKYIIIPKKLGEFKKENAHQSSTLLKHLFVNNGFLAVYDDNLPEDLYKNPCIGLVATFNDTSSLFTIKGNIVLKDCRDQEIFASIEGKSKTKEYKSGYQEVLTESFAGIKALNYKYDPANAGANVTLNFEGDVVKPKKSLENAKRELNKYQDPMAQQTATQTATQTEQSYKQPLTDGSDLINTPVGVIVDAAEVVGDEVMAVEEVVEIEDGGDKVKDAKNSVSEVLYAQNTADGIQLVDSTPKIVYKLTKTSLPEVYLATGQGKNGMIRKADGNWILEYQKGGKTVKEILDIKF